VEGEH